MEAGRTGGRAPRVPKRVPAPAPVCASRTQADHARASHETSRADRARTPHHAAAHACTRSHPIHRWIDPHGMSGCIGKKAKKGLLHAALVPSVEPCLGSVREHVDVHRIVLVRLFNPGPKCLSGPCHSKKAVNAPVGFSGYVTTYCLTTRTWIIHRTTHRCTTSTS
jgi:hypothetical protein